MSERSILFIGASGVAAAGVETMLRGCDAKLTVKRVDALFDGLHALQQEAFNLVLLDLALPDNKGIAAVSQLQQHAPRTPVVVICRSTDRDKAVEAVRKGALDFYNCEEAGAVGLVECLEKALKISAAAEAEKRAAERRTNARFPCRLAVTYQTLEAPIFSGQGTSETLNVSSKGILFTSNEKFEEGQLVQVTLDWPARLENQIPLKLVAEGRVVRNSDGQTAVTIDKYEFRTRRAVAGQAAPPSQKR